MIRLVLRSAGSLLTVAFIAACQADARVKDGDAVSPPVASSTTVAQVSSASNPFATFGYQPSDVDVRSSVPQCVKLRLEASDIAPGDSVRGTLHVDNACESPIAVLTQPVEVRVRLTEQQRFPAELLTSAVYTTAYIFSETAGMPSSSFRGDGGFEVRRVPKYFAIPARSSAALPVGGGGEFTRELPPGAYGLSLLVPVAIGSAFDPMKEPFDLSRSVEQHNEDATGKPLRMPATADRLGAVARFNIRTKID